MEKGVTSQSLVLTGIRDRQTVEALRLEVQRLARRHGVSISNVRIEAAEPLGGAETA